MDPSSCPPWIEPSNAFRLVLKVAKYTADVEYALVEMADQEHELWLDRSIGYSLAQFHNDVATKIIWGPSQTLSIWILDSDTGSEWKIRRDDQWQKMMNDKWNERMAHIALEVTTKHGNSDIPPRSGVPSPNHIAGQVASPNHAVGRLMVSAPVPAPARMAPTLPDEILEDIFLRLHEAADLARASAVCSSFRRAACSRGFLRRFRSLHPPPVLGVLAFENHGVGVLLHAEPPHRSAPAARALAKAADFSFSFVPNPRDPNYSGRDWRVWDTLDGRVLLSKNRYTNPAFEDLMVCDPLHRRYVQIPPIPGDLVPSNRWHDVVDFEPFLAPALEEEEKMHELSFRVLYNVRSSYKVVTLVFSSVTENWRGATSISFLPDRLVNNPRSLVRYYVRGCFYWTCAAMKHMLLLDPLEMKLTLVELPHFYRELPVIVDAGEDKLGVVTVGDRNNTLDLYCKTWWNNDDGAEDWQHKIIPLPELGYQWYIKGAADSYLLLEVIRKGSQIPKQVFYILEVKTLLFERLHVSVSDMGYRRPRFFASFPPPLSLPII